MSNSTDPLGEVDLDLVDLLGPFVIANMFSSMLCGALLVQSSHYFSRFVQDTSFHKIIVAILTMNSLATFGVQCFAQWWFTITSRGPDKNLVTVPQPIYLPIALSLVSQVLSQVYFAKRSFYLCDRNILVGVVFGILIAASFIIQFVGTVKVFRQPGADSVLNGSLLKYLSLSHPGIDEDVQFVVRCDEIGLIFAAVTDLVITGALTWKLLGQRHGFRPSTDNLIGRVVRFSVSTAAITAIFETTTAIILFASFNSHDYVYYVIYQLSHLQALVAVWSLNLRDTLTQQRNEDRDFKPPTEFLRTSSSGHFGPSREIRVERSQVQKIEMAKPGSIWRPELKVKENDGSRRTSLEADNGPQPPC